MNNNSLGGVSAARQFHQLVRNRDPRAQAIFHDIIKMARLGDPEAIRAVRLMQYVMRTPTTVWTGQINNPRPVVTPQQIEGLRLLAVRARNTPYIPALVPQNAGAGQGPFTQIPGGVVGYAGEGIYQIIKPGGLGLFSGPTMNQPPVRMLPFESLVRVFAQAENSYVQIDQPAPGYVCMSCAELPGGPWLLRKS